MRGGATLGVAEAARSPPCTHPFPGRRSHSRDAIPFSLYLHEYLAMCKECWAVYAFYLWAWGPSSE